MFYVKNVPAWERIVRVLLGLVSIVLAIYAFDGAVAYVLSATAAGIALSGLVGFCPMCAMVGRRLDAATKSDNGTR